MMISVLRHVEKTPIEMNSRNNGKEKFMRDTLIQGKVWKANNASS